jgi:hypothetical protein
VPDKFIYKEHTQPWLGIWQQPSSPPALVQRFSFNLHNMVLRRGMPHVRPGLVRMNGVRFGDGTFTMYGMHVFPGTPDRLIVACGSLLQSMNLESTTLGADPVTLTTAYPSGFAARTGQATIMEALGGRLFIVNGLDENVKFNGTNLTRMGQVAPSALSSPSNAGGTFNGTWTYKATLVSSAINGSYESEPTTALTVVYSNQQGTFSAPTVPSADPQVDRWNLYRTTQGGSSYYRINTTPLTLATTQLDLVTDAALPTGTALAPVGTNSPPPGKFRMLTVHQGRLVGVLANSNTLYWSDLGLDLGGLYVKPDCWPLENNLQFGENGGNAITALVSFYEWLVVIQDFGVWSISGDLNDENDRTVKPVLVASDRRGIGVSFIGNVAAAENKIILASKDGLHEITRSLSTFTPDLSVNLMSHNVSGLYQQINFSSGGTAVYDRDQRRFVFFGKGKDAT